MVRNLYALVLNLGGIGKKEKKTKKKRRKHVPGEFLNASLPSYWFGARVYTTYTESKLKM